MAISKLQLLEEESSDSSATQAWDKSLPKEMLELAARMAASYPSVDSYFKPIVQILTTTILYFICVHLAFAIRSHFF